jgi:hypothetical protein
VIILREMDLPEGVTAEQAVALALGAERAAEETVIVIRGDCPTPDPKAIRPVDDHEPAPIEASNIDERGQSPITVLQGLCSKADLELEIDDSGNLIMTERYGKKMRRTFADISMAISVVRARIKIGADEDRRQAREAEAAAKGEPEPVPAGRDHHAELAQMCRHYEIDCQLGPVITLTGKPFTKTFPRIEDAVEFLRKRQF